ncbi:Chromate transport protein ChrA [Devosia sp. DBB001]|nr:Chromate transport protein ChrA [Devosia sp. DBB001]
MPPSFLSRLAEVFLVFLQLGLTSFGGPVAHLGYFREAFVVRRKWLSDADYADLVALCQFLPGPASSQVGIAIGQLRAGYIGAFAAWLAFTLPSVLLLLAFAYGLSALPWLANAGILHGLKIAALAVVAQAVWSMGRSLAPDPRRQIIALVSAIIVLLIPNGLVQLAVLAAAILFGVVGKPATTVSAPDDPAPRGRREGLVFLVLFFVLLAGLPLLANLTGNGALDIFDRFYRTGSLVFGGGHVVLPLLEGELVAPGFIGRDLFLAGYGAAQAVPGPLFSFAAYAGALLTAPPNGLAGASLALIGIYLPSFLLVLGALPFWHRMRANPRMRAALETANAAVVGLLLAALYDPVFTSAVSSPRDFALALAAFGALTLLRVPPWLLVLTTAATYWAL